MMVSGSSGSGKMNWTRKLLLSLLVKSLGNVSYGVLDNQFGNTCKRNPCVELTQSIPDYLIFSQFNNHEQEMSQ